MRRLLVLAASVLLLGSIASAVLVAEVRFQRARADRAEERVRYLQRLQRVDHAVIARYVDLMDSCLHTAQGFGRLLERESR